MPLAGVGDRAVRDIREAGHALFLRLEGSGFAGVGRGRWRVFGYWVGWRMLLGLAAARGPPRGCVGSAACGSGDIRARLHAAPAA